MKQQGSKFIRSTSPKHWKQDITAVKMVSRAMALRSFVNVAYFADILGLANCASPDSVFNSGIPLCDLAKGKIKGVILADRGVSFTPADRASVASMIAAIKTKTTAARGSRVYPVFDINNFEDSTGEPQTGSIGNLSTATIVVQDGIPVFRFGYNGSEKRHARMALMNGASLDVFFIDDKFAMYGTQSGDNLKGYNVLQAYTYVSRFIVADAVNQYSFQLTLGSIAEYRENSNYVVLNSGVLSAQGLIDVELFELSNVANVYKIQPIADGGTNLSANDTTNAAIAGLTFTAKRLDTGAAIPITSVAADNTLDALTVTFDSTAWTAAAGQDVQLNGPSAADLAGAGVKPYEMIPVIIAA